MGKRKKTLSSNPTLLPGEITNPQMADFARLYMNGWTGEDGRRVRMGSGYLAYAKAYGIDIGENKERYGYCCVAASQLIRTPKCQGMMDAILLANGWEPRVVDNRTVQIITTGKPSDAIAAIKEFNQVMARITKNVTVTSKVKLESFLDEPD